MPTAKPVPLVLPPTAYKPTYYPVHFCSDLYVNPAVNGSNSSVNVSIVHVVAN